MQVSIPVTIDSQPATILYLSDKIQLQSNLDYNMLCMSAELLRLNLSPDIVKLGFSTEYLQVKIHSLPYMARYNCTIDGVKYSLIIRAEKLLGSFELTWFEWCRIE